MSDSLPQNRYCSVCRSVYPDEVKFCPKDGAALEAPQHVLGGRFVLKERIGAGNMGTVHRAVQLPMGREVAVKLLHPEMALNPDMVARFEREALAASTVDHPNAITIYDSGKTDDNEVFIAMEFLEGESLAAILRREHRLAPERALELWMPAVKAMVVAHRKGVLHRDLKPDNIFVAKKVNEEGVSEEVIKVLDFGIAKLLEGHRGNRAALKTVAGVRIGTAMYMAPEQLEGREASKQSDVYGLGLILIELITGRMPWGRGGDEGDTMLTMLRLVNPPLPLGELCPEQTFSPELQRFFLEVLAIDPAKRPADAGELLRRVAQLPEAAALTQGGVKRSEISLMMTAAAMAAEISRGSEAGALPAALMSTLPIAAGPGRQRPEEHLPVPADLPSAPTKVKAGMVGDGSGAATPAQAAPDDTLPRHAHLAGSSGVRDLPQVPTVITANRQPTPPRGALVPDPGQTLPSVAPIKSLHSSQMLTLPTAMSAPQLPSPPGEPAPTVPMQLARVPRGLSAAGRQATTLPSVGASSATLRAEGLGPAQRRGLLLLLALGAVVLSGVAYLMLRPGGSLPTHRRSPPDAAASPLVVPSVDSADAGSDRAATPPPEDPGPRLAPRPPSGSDDPVPVRHRGSVLVTFIRRRPAQLSISCGTPPRPCVDSCSVSPGEQCQARSPGYQPKRFSYDDLKGRGSRSRARIEVKLTAAP